ncbi:MAG: alpha/beta fold hydrolase, partial [Streptosporangiaceae bacterium]
VRAGDASPDGSAVRLPPRRSSFVGRTADPPRAVREAASRIPGCRYSELPGLGHGAPLLAAGQVNPILAEFLD